MSEAFAAGLKQSIPCLMTVRSPETPSLIRPVLLVLSSSLTAVALARLRVARVAERSWHVNVAAIIADLDDDGDLDAGAECSYRKDK